MSFDGTDDFSDYDKPRKTHFYVEQYRRSACGVELYKQGTAGEFVEADKATCMRCRTWLDRKPRQRASAARNARYTPVPAWLTRETVAALDAIRALDGTPQTHMLREAVEMWLADRYARGPGAVRAAIRQALGRVPGQT
jgi:hypothetical protein